MLKCRAMYDAYERDGAPLADADRLACFGRFLRKAQSMSPLSLVLTQLSALARS
jgi:hypothetical protein